jgi:tRNA-modifying protein YgfZ
VHFAGPGAFYPAQVGLPSVRSLPTFTRLPMGSFAMPPASFALLDQRGIIAVSGKDRRSFLQGLVSNDVEKVSPVEARYAALLTAQGKYLHDFMMVEFDGAVWLEAEATRLGDLKRRLSIYRLRAKAALEERPDLAVAVVYGDGAPAAVCLSEEPGATRMFGSGVAFVDPRLAALGVRCIVPRVDIRGALEAVGITETGFPAYDRLRLELGIPDGGRDLIPEKSILLEAGFDELNGIDWQKGCYIGQELTARTKYRGLIKKRLMPVKIDGTAPAPGTNITADGREVGEMRSSCDGLGLALLRIEPVVQGKRLKAGAISIIASKPGWMRLSDDASPEG